MRKVLKESGHLVRMALVLIVAIIVFLGIRAAIVPKTFGDYGHYRASSLDDIRARPVSFAGKATCEICHEEVAKKKLEGKHAGIACEACHGPSAAHTEDPSTNHAVKPEIATLCVRCHEADPARPKSFPQVVSKDHSMGMPCGTCHQPHSPKP
jgi:hypothetical protein